MAIIAAVVTVATETETSNLIIFTIHGASVLAALTLQ
jgi:branched-subunit amino acid transport protein